MVSIHIIYMLRVLHLLLGLIEKTQYLPSSGVFKNRALHCALCGTWDHDVTIKNIHLIEKFRRQQGFIRRPVTNDGVERTNAYSSMKEKIRYQVC